MKKPFKFESLTEKRSVERTVLRDGVTIVSSPVSTVHESAKVRSDVQRLFTGSKELVQLKYGQFRVEPGQAVTLKLGKGSGLAVKGTQAGKGVRVAKKLKLYGR